MPSVDFALIAHIETWSIAAEVIAALRGATHPPIPLAELREIVPWIPARTVCRLDVTSMQGHVASGVYIDCFIPPDRLGDQFLRENLLRVRQAAACAVRERARIAALGGFSSILLEGKTDLLPPSNTAFTTGNTLTVALLVRGVERALELAGRDLRQANLLIIGASGDVGSGCARCFGPRVNRLLLCARNAKRLQTVADELTKAGTRVDASTDLALLAKQADLVICAASLPAPALLLDTLPPSSIVCDAGYPKNLLPAVGRSDTVSFFGGFGQARGGIRPTPDLLHTLYPYPFTNLAHGCLLEAITLALEKRFEAFSQGRGMITPRRVEEMWGMASRHGIVLPPLFNQSGLVEDRLASLPREVNQ